MQWKVSMIALIGLSVLCVTGCSVQRKALRSSTELRTTESRIDTVREQVMVAVHDTVREVTTITVQQNEMGDTVFRSVVTERDRARERAAVRDKDERVIVKTDTVYVEKRDSSFVKNTNCTNDTNKDSWGHQLARVLKWMVAMIIALCVLIVIVKVKR